MTKSLSRSAAASLRAAEESWQEPFERLQERFPTVAPGEIWQALRANAGHAGHAASDLRDMEYGPVKEADPDDSEWVATLLSNPTLFKATCKERFQKFDANRNGVLEWPEVVALVGQLSHRLGLEAPSEKSLRSFFFDANDDNKDGVLSEKEFTKFFESFLRYAFFMDHRRLVGIWRYQPDPSLPSLSEFRVSLTKDWRLQYRSSGGLCPGAPLQQEHGELGGTLELREGWLEAELKQGTRISAKKLALTDAFGCIRLRLADAGGDVVVASFMAASSGEWGSHVLCRRVSEGSPPQKKTRDAWRPQFSRPGTPVGF